MQNRGTMKKFCLFFAIVFCFLGNIHSEDWEPEVFDNYKFEKANDAVKEHILKNGTYLSGIKDFSFFHLDSLSANENSGSVGNHKSIFAIVYNKKAYYFNASDYCQGPAMDYSIISCEPPVIYLKFKTNVGVNTAVISYDGTDFLMNSTDCVFAVYDDEDAGRFKELLTIPMKYCYFQGRKIFSRSSHSQFYVFSDEKEKISDINSHYRFNFYGIDGAKSINKLYYQTVVTDDNLRLRTSPSKEANVITLLKKGTKVRVLSIDPAITQMEGKDGFWVLVETKSGFIGWIWSNYLNRFYYESTRHFLDREPVKNW